MGLQAFHEVPSVATMKQEAMHVAAGLLVCLNGLVEHDGHVLLPLNARGQINLDLPKSRPAPGYSTRAATPLAAHLYHIPKGRRIAGAMVRL